MEVVETASKNVADAPPRIQGWLPKIQSLGNVPRVERKFRNFLGNSLRLRDETIVTEIWQYLSELKSRQKAEKQEATAEKDTAGSKAPETEAVAKAETPNGETSKKADVHRASPGKKRSREDASDEAGRSIPEKVWDRVVQKAVKKKGGSCEKKEIRRFVAKRRKLFGTLSAEEIRDGVMQTLRRLRNRHLDIQGKTVSIKT
eukprot:scaffold1197_cov228-Pinguiococcus_pyrenoidosus.AAC.7